MRLRCTNAPSAARFFVQLSARSQSHSLLDVLLPPQARFAHDCRALAAKSLSIRRPRAARNGGRIADARGSVSNLIRTFSSTSAARRTLPVHNPQVDEEGQEMVVEMTPRAANRLSQIMKKDNNPQLALRIQVESGGCHGFQYVMSLTTLPSSTAADAPPPPSPSAEAGAEIAPSTTLSTTPSESVIREDDTIFTFVKEGEETAEVAAGPKIILDGPSLDLLKGSKLDYTMELIGSQFKIVDNPAATSSCGCGTSFDIKF